MIWPMIDVSVLQVIYRFKLAQAVPLDGGATYAQIAEKTGLSEHRVSSVIRQAMTNQIFHEDSLNHVVHTAISAILVKDPAMWDWVGYFVEEAYPSSARWTEAMLRYPNSQEPNESPFAVAFSDAAPEGFFKYLSDNKVTQARFFGAMKGVGTAPGLQYHHVANGYAWDRLGSATVVDVGGSTGHVSIALAKIFPNLNFVVQDFPHTVQQAQESLPAEFQERISFMPHDIFRPQPVRGSVYLMRHICHDWSDKYSIKILQQIVPAMDADSKIIMVEHVVLPPGHRSFLEEKQTRNLDLHMFTMLNSQERSADEWARLVAAADPRLKIASIQKPPGSDDSVIEVVLSQS
ncbi:hypothetical protein ABVK25_004755 [Lepraria finkii]|uniref:O-methyltransferase C-terminal domain-containing protein n=1 Tax=Lepraria finkii TaxID=1340010 RepID=A0ABR4BBX9_9LECA